MVRKQVADMFADSYRLNAKEIDLSDSEALASGADSNDSTQNNKVFYKTSLTGKSKSRCKEADDYLKTLIQVAEAAHRFFNFIRVFSADKHQQVIARKDLGASVGNEFLRSATNANNKAARWQVNILY